MGQSESKPSHWLSLRSDTLDSPLRVLSENPPGYLSNIWHNAVRNGIIHKLLRQISINECPDELIPILEKLYKNSCAIFIKSECKYNSHQVPVYNLWCSKSLPFKWATDCKLWFLMSDRQYEEFQRSIEDHKKRMIEIEQQIIDDAERALASLE